MSTHPGRSVIADALPRSDRGSPVLAVTGLTAGYHDAPAVRELDLSVSAGEVVALFGPNGAGKTTTLLACVGVLPAMAGTVTWQGNKARRPMHRLVRDCVSIVPERRAIISRLTVRDNLKLGRGGVDPAVAIFPELQAHLGRPAGLLSGGQQQMLVVARALATRPKCLLVDELSLGLAPQIVDRLLDAIAARARDDGMGVLLVEQQAHRAFGVAHRWYLLHNGRLAASGQTSDGIEQLETAYIAGLHGTQAVAEQAS